MLSGLWTVIVYSKQSPSTNFEVKEVLAMAVDIVAEIHITVQDYEQAEKIYEALENGLAETAIKDRVLYGAIGPQQVVGPQQPTFASSAKSKEASIELKPVETKNAQTVKPIKVEEKTQERPRGILGQKRLGRTGRR